MRLLITLKGVEFPTLASGDDLPPAGTPVEQKPVPAETLRMGRMGKCPMKNVQCLPAPGLLRGRGKYKIPHIFPDFIQLSVKPIGLFPRGSLGKLIGSSLKDNFGLELIERRLIHLPEFFGDGGGSVFVTFDADKAGHRNRPCFYALLFKQRVQLEGQ